MTLSAGTQRIIRRLRRAGFDAFSLVWRPDTSNPYHVCVEGDHVGPDRDYEVFEAKGRTADRAFLGVSWQWDAYCGKYYPKGRTAVPCP